MSRTSDYWLSSVREALSDADITATESQVLLIAAHIVVSVEKMDMGAPKGQWIAVSERLPILGFKVVGWTEHGFRLVTYGPSEIDNGNHWLSACTGQRESVTHWMPIPAPPAFTAESRVERNP